MTELRPPPPKPPAPQPQPPASPRANPKSNFLSVRWAHLKSRLAAAQAGPAEVEVEVEVLTPSRPCGLHRYNEVYVDQ
jgi:hypothetical protein